MPTLDNITRVTWASATVPPLGQVGLLDLDERRRMDSYDNSWRKAHFLVGCIQTKIALATLMGRDPADIELGRACSECGGPHGPVTQVPFQGVHISISHSGGWVAVALASHPVGLDVERKDRQVGEALWHVALRPSEQLEVSRQGVRDRDHAVLRYWTRKEAILKCTGHGLTVEPTELQVAAPDERPRLLDWPRHPELIDALTLRDVTAPQGHLASIAGVTRGPMTVHSAPSTSEACSPAATCINLPQQGT